MQTPNLPLQIASGILLAVVVVWFFRLGIAHAQRRDWQSAFLTLGPTCLVGGGLILAGLGLVSW